MSAVQPKCYGHCGKVARAGKMFCADKCAALYAEELVRGNEDHWCPVCEDWKTIDRAMPGKLICGHVTTEIVEGCTHKAAAKKYEAAIEEVTSC
jgi:hypothetical protein